MAVEPNPPNVLELNPPNTDTIGDLIVSPYIDPNAQLTPIDGAPDDHISRIQLNIHGQDASVAQLSLGPNAPPGFVVAPIAPGSDHWSLVYLGAGNPTDAQWSQALDALEGTTTNGSFGSFNVAVQAYGGPAGHEKESNLAHDRVFCCFTAGTLISTPQGPKNVESLEIGDKVTTTDGCAVPIRWVGRQTISRIFADPMRVLPIRVKANALEDNVPSRDLLISPDHALLVDGVLIQAGALVNGTSIVREHNTPQVFVYYHVELADHSLILAENAPAETFIDNVDRLAFDNWGEHEALYGESAPIVEMKYPRAKAARQVPKASRLRLAVRGSNLYSEERANVA